MADTQTLALEVQTTPGDYVLSAAQLLTIGAIYAKYDGSGAAGDYIPTVEIISDSGHKVISVPHDTTITGGSDAEASWAPFLKAQQKQATPSGTATAAFTGGWAGVGIADNTVTDLNTGWATDGGHNAAGFFTFGAGGRIEVEQACWCVYTLTATFAAPFAGQRYLTVQPLAANGTIQPDESGGGVIIEGSDPGETIVLSFCGLFSPSVGNLVLQPEIFQHSGAGQTIDATRGVWQQIVLLGV